ncbi:RNA-binding protein [Thiorhodococcus minor]|uniref:RNA-binding protein n=1 Tax=Thiorhodococcus minor TaxID=57489 RepID=A0A6M0JYA9_9GAMM|nr:RNA-binding protein [Thiorhodococcus minor]NEV61085.1 RNA-binding protein [Thiorhodococcus minor]
MEIFIGNLPGQATIVELTGFLEGVALKPDYHCYEGRDKDNRNYHYFVARAASRADGLALIARLNGQLFGGRPIEAREYHRRAPCSEWPGAERRVNAM